MNPFCAHYPAADMVLLGARFGGTHNCDGNHEANRTSNSNEHARAIIPQRCIDRPNLLGTGWARTLPDVQTGRQAHFP
jgi:hypothetical protein